MTITRAIMQWLKMECLMEKMYFDSEVNHDKLINKLIKAARAIKEANKVLLYYDNKRIFNAINAVSIELEKLSKEHGISLED